MKMTFRHANEEPVREFLKRSEPYMGSKGSKLWMYAVIYATR